MSFNQKIMAVVTVLVVGLTAAITFVCFEPPYAINFWVAYAAVSLSEFLVGAFLIRQLSEHRDLPLSFGTWGFNLLYVAFTLTLTFFTDMREARFFLLQLIGFVVLVIIHLFFRMAEHHIERQSEDDLPKKRIERAKITWR